MPARPLQWSAEIEFHQDAISGAVPRDPGVYQVLQSSEYARYKGTTRVLKIGKSEADLCQELLNHFQRHTVSNRLTRVRGQGDVVVTVVFAKTDAESAAAHERTLLRAFEDAHWDLPVLNSQRGYERGTDDHYREVSAT